MLDRVIQQVHQCLLHCMIVPERPLDGRIPLRLDHRDVHLVLAGDRLHQRDGPPQQRRDVHRLEAILLAAAIHARKVEHVLHQHREPPALLHDEMVIVALLGRARDASMPQAFGHQLHCRDRRAQLMTRSKRSRISSA
jgi:hypothetical protein